MLCKPWIQDILQETVPTFQVFFIKFSIQEASLLQFFTSSNNIQYWIKKEY
jgi:hypothetical protein